MSSKPTFHSGGVLSNGVYQWSTPDQETVLFGEGEPNNNGDTVHLWYSPEELAYKLADGGGTALGNPMCETGNKIDL